MPETKTVKKMNKGELTAYLTQNKVTFDEKANADALKSIALAYEHLQGVKSTLTAREIAFTDENTIEELEAMLQESDVVLAKEQLTARSITFADDATAEEILKLLEDTLKDEAEKASESEKTSKIPEGYVQVRNEKNRTVNGLKPWRIAVIKEENLSLYLSYGCVLYTGQGVSEEAPAEEVGKGKDDTPPHLRK